MVMHALANLPALYRVPVWLTSLLSVSFLSFLFDLAISATAAAIWRWRGKGCASLFFPFFYFDGMIYGLERKSADAVVASFLCFPSLIAQLLC